MKYITLVSFAVAALAAATVRVDLGPGLAAVGTAYETSAGDARERFTHIPYATRERVFEMPVPLDYRTGAIAGSTGADISATDFALGVSAPSALLATRIVNPLEGAAIAPDQGMTMLVPEYSAHVGVQTPPEEEVRCMQLDVFRPASPTATPRRVVVFLHGGMMESGHRGSVLYRPDDFMRSLASDPVTGEETIVVSVEYSLGAYGWLYESAGVMPKSDAANPLSRVYGTAPANLALHQVIQALIWVQRHIAAFNGNPHDVTLAGHSAGATIAHWVHLVLTSRTKARYGITDPLFHKLLLMGGSALLFPASTVQEAAALAKSVVSKTPCARTVGAARLECLRGLESTVLRDASVASHAVWTPVIDGLLVTDRAEALLARQETPTRDWDNNISLLLTVTADETALFCIVFKTQLEQDLRSTWTTMGIDEQHADALIAAEHSETLRNPLAATSRRSRDICFWAPAVTIRDAYLAAGVPNAQIAQIELVFDANVHDLVVSKLDAACLKFKGVSFAVAAAALRVKGGAQALISGGLSRVTSFGSGLLSVFSSSPATGGDTTSDHTSSSKRSFLSFGGMFGSSPQETAMYDSGDRTTHSKSMSAESAAVIKSQAEDEYLYGVPMLTEARLQKLIDGKTLPAFARLVEEHVSGFGTFHGLDQIVLLNVTLNFSGIVIRADELFSQASGEAINTPVRSFIATGMAVAPGGLPLAPLDVKAYETCCRVDSRRIIASIKRNPGDVPVFNAAYAAHVVDTIGHSEDTYASLSVQIRGLHPRDAPNRRPNSSARLSRDEEDVTEDVHIKEGTRKRKAGGKNDH